MNNNKIKNLKNTLVGVRMSKQEKTLFQEHADKEGLSLQKFMIERLLKSIFYDKDQTYYLKDTLKNAISIYVENNMRIFTQSIIENIENDKTMLNLKKVMRQNLFLTMAVAKKVLDREELREAVDGFCQKE